MAKEIDFSAIANGSSGDSGKTDKIKDFISVAGGIIGDIFGSKNSGSNYAPPQQTQMDYTPFLLIGGLVLLVKLLK